MILNMIGFVGTVVCYYLCKWIYKKFRLIFLTPLITCLILVIAIVLILKMPYATYMASAKFLTDMLGPATVALAIPLYRNVHILKKHWIEFVVSLSLGAIIAVMSSVLLARAFRLSHAIWSTVAPRSVTTPIAMDISQTVGGIPALTAVFVIITALCGIVVGPLVIRFLRIRSAIARGALLGLGAHGVGTSRAFEFGQMEGACASLSMILTACMTFVLAPLLVPLIS